MISIQETTDKEILRHIISDPKLWASTYGQNPNITKTTWEPEPGANYLLLQKDEELLGFMYYRPLHGFLLEIHAGIKSKYWGKRITLKALKKVCKYLKNQGSIFYTMVPNNCYPVLNSILQLGFQPCGVIEKSTIYNNQIVNTLLLQVSIDTCITNLINLIKNGR